MATSISHRHIFFNNFSNVMKLVSYLAVSFFMMPFYVKTLGVTLYGIWTIVITVVGYMALIDFGMQSAVMKYIAECEGQNDREGISDVIASALVFYSFIAVMGGIALSAVVWKGFHLFKVNSEHLRTVQSIVLILGIDMILVFPGTVFHGVLTGMQMFYVTNLVTISLLFVRVGAIYLALSRGNGLVAMALISLIGNLVEYSIFFLLVRFRYCLFRLERSHFTIDRLRQMISFGTKSFLVMISNKVYLSGDSLLVGYFMSAAWVPFYTIPASLIGYSRVLLWSLTQSFLPLFSNLEAKKEFQTIQSTLMRYTRYTCICFFPLLFFLVIYGEPFIRIWMGPQFAERGKLVILLLSISLSMSAIQPLGARLLTGMSKQNILISAGFVSAGSFLGLGVLLIQAYGLPGLAAAFLAAETIPSFFVLKRTLAAISLSFDEYFWKGLFLPLIAAFITSAILWLIKEIHYPTGYFELILQSGFGVLICAILSYKIALVEEERIRIWLLLNSLSRIGLTALRRS